MIRPGDFWGACPYRRLTYDTLTGNLKAFYYRCNKMDCPCNPSYCLGPDEEVDDESKGETHE